MSLNSTAAPESTRVEPTARIAAGAFPPFRPRFPWFGPDLQTLRNFVVRPDADFAAWPGQPIELPTRDGSGDMLTGVLHAAGEETKPMILLLHGLTGCNESFYVLSTARYLLALGYPVMRLNWRSAGSSRSRCAQEYHAGRSEDLRAAIAGLPAPWRARAKVAVGYSLGANILLKYLGEEGAASGISAAVAISAPLDLAAAGARFREPRNWLYHHFILRGLKRDLARGSGPVDAGLLKAGLAARTLRAFDDRYIAPRYGFRDAEDYYAKCSGNRHLGGIRVPTLLVHAGDDPWIPAAIYRSLDWSAMPTCRLLLPHGGGHVGFHGAGTSVPWTDRCIAAFLRTG